MAYIPAAIRRFMPDPGEVCSHNFWPTSGWCRSSNSVTDSGSRCRSTTTSWDSSGVSTSTKPRDSKKLRTRASRTARAFKVSRLALGRKSEFTASVLHRYPLDVFPRPRIDLQHVADVDENRRLDFGAGFKLDGLGDVGGRDAAGPGLAVFDFQFYMRRRRHADRPIVEHEHLAGHPLLEVHPAVLDRNLGHLVLLVVLVIHE